MSTAQERLYGGYYNSAGFSGANPGGMGNGGHVENFPSAIQDIGTVAQAVGVAAQAAHGSATAAGQAATAGGLSAAAAAQDRAAAQVAATAAANSAAAINPNTYLPKAGGAMTGALTVPAIVLSGGSAYFYSDDGGKTINVRAGAPGVDRFFSFGLDGWVHAPNGGFRASGNAVFHAGNDGSGSGLDADLLRGLAPSVSGAASSLAARNAAGETEFAAVVFFGSGGKLAARDANTLGWNLSLYLDGGLSASEMTHRSDRRLKRAIIDLEPSNCRLRPRRYTLKETGADRIGFVAQEAAETHPGVVRANDAGILEIDTVALIAVLARQLNSALDRIDALEAVR